MPGEYKLLTLYMVAQRSFLSVSLLCRVDILQLFATMHRATEMRPRSWKPLVIVLPWTAIVLAVLYLIYRLVDPLPPRQLAIAAGAAASGYDNFARQYEKILARHGVELEVHNSAGAVENLGLLRDAASGVQAALATFGITNRVMRTSSIHSVGYSMQRHSFFTGMPSPSRNLPNSVANAFPSACREPRCDPLSCRFWKRLTQ